MNNIKQKFLNFSFLIICLFSFSACETTTPKENAKQTIEQLEIAILMPMSGENAVLGQQYNKLIKMGLNDGVKTYIKITSYDGADKKQILHAMEKIIARKTKIILGPLYSPLTSLIAEKAKKHNIILITLSNDPTLADEKLFVFGHAPLKQLEKMVNYFLDKDYKNFIALLPAGNYSHTVSKIMQDMIIQKNATLARVEFYSDTPESINKSISLVSDNVDNLNEMDDSLTKPVVYLADDQKNMPLIFEALNKYNLDKKAIIAGDNRIDIEYPSRINITFTGSLNIFSSDVPERAKDLGIPLMTFMHTMAYDLGKMVATYISDKYVEQRFLDKMNSRAPYMGISGKIYFIDSIAQRDYDIIRKEEEYNTLPTDN